MKRSDDSQTVRPAALVQGSGARRALSAPDEEWIERLRAGDPVALDKLARQEAPRVAHLLARILGPRTDLEDLVQIVFLETCRSLPRYRGEGALSSFIGGITVRVARRAMRPTAWFTRRSHADVEAIAKEDPERSTVEAEQLRRVHRALGKIAPKKRIAFLLWALDGMDVQGIAELMGASPAATKSRIYYAQKELKSMAARDPHLRGLLQGGGDGTG